jgi:hypothetical protein
VLRRAFGPKRKEVNREVEKTTQRGTLSSVLFTKYLDDQVKETEMGRACSMHGGERRYAYGVLVGKPQGKRELGRPRCRWEDNIKTEFREAGRGARNGSIWLRTGTGGGLL